MSVGKDRPSAVCGAARGRWWLGVWLWLAHTASSTQNHIAPLLHRNSCSVALGGHMYPIGRASLRDYTLFTANRYRKTGPETVQEQLAANESSQIIYRTLVSQSNYNCCFSVSYSSQDPQNPLYQQNKLVVADCHVCTLQGRGEL